MFQTERVEILWIQYNFGYLRRIRSLPKHQTERWFVAVHLHAPLQDEYQECLHRQSLGGGLTREKVSSALGAERGDDRRVVPRDGKLVQCFHQ